MRVSLFFLTLSFIIFSISFLFYKRFAFAFKSKKIKVILGIVFFLLASFLVFPPLSYRSIVPYEQKSLMGVMLHGHYLFLGFFSFLVLSLVFFTLIQAMTYFIIKRKNSKISPSHDLSLERRQFITQIFNGAILTTSSLTTLGIYANDKRSPQVVKVQVPIENLPSSLKGFKIAQISDVHIGPTLDRNFLESIVFKINELNVDMVAITGDLVDGTVKQIGPQLDNLQSLRSTHGTFFCCGNHEYYWDVHAWYDYLEQLNIKVLENNNVIIKHNHTPVLVAGVPDRGTFKSNSKPQWAASNKTPTLLKILLAHRPDSCYEAQKCGFDLQLSGHTHAGQFSPWTLIARFVHPYFRGIYNHLGMWLYVNPGTGYWGPPLRTVQSEITLIELTQKA